MNDIATIILDNLESWSLGFLSGWVVCHGVVRLYDRHRRHAEMHEVSMHAAHNHRLIALLPTVVVVLATAVVVILAEKYDDSLAEVWNMCRHINYPLGVLVAVGVVYRLVLMTFDRPRWHDARALHLMFWFAYIAGNLLAAALTSHHYEEVGVDATWASALRTVLMTGGLVLTVWWPHPTRYSPLEERVT